MEVLNRRDVLTVEVLTMMDLMRWWAPGVAGDAPA